VTQQRGAPPDPGLPSNYLRLELPAMSANLALARATVAAFAAGLPFTVEELGDLKVAVSEAVSNVVLHAYPAGGGAVLIVAEINGLELTVTIEDQGCGIADIDQARQPAYTTVADRMGLGFALMDSFCDEVTVSSQVGQGTRVVLRKLAGHRTQGGNAVPYDRDPDQPPL